jgi:hypothetical protein
MRLLKTIAILVVVLSLAYIAFREFAGPAFTELRQIIEPTEERTIDAGNIDAGNIDVGNIDAPADSSTDSEDNEKPADDFDGADYSDEPDINENNDSLQEAQEPVEVLIREIGDNIKNLNENFSLNITGLGQAAMSDINLLEHFPELSQLGWQGTFYFNGDDSAYADIEVSLVISMAYKIFTAYQSGMTELLNAQEKQVLDVVINVIRQEIRQDMSDFEKELAIHDYIIRVCDYDSENHARGTIPDTSYTPYGVLVLGRAVCEGYSNAFKLFMDMLDIECDIISGWAGEQSHAWNRVKIGGEYYLVDVTWNDPVPASGAANTESRIHYEFFNVTDAFLGATHEPDKPQTKIADSTRYNYFYYNNLVVSSKEEFISILRDRVSNGENYIYLLYKNVDLRPLVESREIFDYLGNNTRISFSFSEKADTLYMRFS